jgi:hypothetical protein
VRLATASVHRCGASGVLRSSGGDRYEGYRDIAHAAIDRVGVDESGFVEGALKTMRDLLLNIMLA